MTGRQHAELLVTTMRTRNRVVAYTRVSTHEQGDSGLGLEAQEATIRRELEHRARSAHPGQPGLGWQLVELLEDRASTGANMKRPGLQRALGLLGDGTANVLMVSKLDRLSRSTVDFAGLLARSHAEGWAIVALDLGLDTSSNGGRLMAHIMASVAEFERGAISDRTRDALAAKKARGERLGARRSIPEEIRARVRDERTAGHTYRAIADGLSADHPDRTWHATTLRRLAKER